MNDIKDFLTNDEVTPEAIKEIEEHSKITKNFFIDNAKEIYESIMKVQSNTDQPVELRTMTIALPPIFWNALEQFSEMFNIRRDMGMKSEEEVDMVQENILKNLKDKTNLTTQEAVTSQIILDNVVDFTQDLVKQEFLTGLMAISLTNDPDKISEYIDQSIEKLGKGFIDEAFGDADDNDDNEQHDLFDSEDSDDSTEQ